MLHLNQQSTHTFDHESGFQLAHFWYALSHTFQQNVAQHLFFNIKFHFWPYHLLSSLTCTPVRERIWQTRTVEMRSNTFVHSFLPNPCLLTKGGGYWPLTRAQSTVRRRRPEEFCTWAQARRVIAPLLCLMMPPHRPTAVSCGSTAENNAHNAKCTRPVGWGGIGWRYQNAPACSIAMHKHGSRVQHTRAHNPLGREMFFAGWHKEFPSFMSNSICSRIFGVQQQEKYRMRRSDRISLGWKQVQWPSRRAVTATILEKKTYLCWFYQCAAGCMKMSKQISKSLNIA